MLPNEGGQWPDRFHYKHLLGWQMLQLHVQSGESPNLGGMWSKHSLQLLENTGTQMGKRSISPLVS